MHESASSIVCRAVRGRDRHPVILKCTPVGASTSRQLTRLRNEFALLRSLSVEGVVNAYELVQSHGQLALVTEQFPGYPLREWLTRKKPALHARLRAAIQFAKVIGAVHAAGVIHKDINSQNLLYDARASRACLVDFGLATRLRYQEGKFRPATALEGTLAYIAPEQTGRMNRSVDHRADWYSFGVTLYELFSGRLPKESSDPLELVHFHIAGTPAPLHQLCDIPEMLSAIVARLLRKAPEERYQSAAGLVADLERCLQELGDGNAIRRFELGAQDVIERFEPPQKLYGRDREAAVLVETLHQVAAGKVCTVRVAGAAGIGKTSLVQEMHEAITDCRGLFASGKFDQLRRDVPFSALVDALQELVEQLLTGGPEAVEQWRLEIRAAVGGNGRVLLDVIPSLELIIGEQPELPALTGFEAQNRFTLVFQNFIQVFARRAHPLVLFLDDMQWADPASLSLLTQMLARPDTESLLVIQAYRDNQVDASHPFALAMLEQDKRGISASTIPLGPVQVADVAALLADTLRAPTQNVQSLATLICQKTAGNPFFIRQFLRTLHAEGLLAFDAGTRSFIWDLEAVRSAAITENVAEFLAAKLARLPEDTRDALRFAAAIGARFDLSTLATVLRVSEGAVAQQLQPALAEELVLALTPLESLDANAVDSALVHRRYAFLHDRVQSAAYDLIDAPERPALHLRIGRMLGGGAGADELGPRLFEVVNHLNQGESLIQEEQERLNLARLNYRAALRARNSTAYSLAVRCLSQSLALLGGEQGWERHQRRAIEAHLKLAEVLALNAQHADAFGVIETALARAQSRLQRTQLRALQVQTHLSIGQMAEALACGCAAASEFDIELPQDAAGLERVLPGQIGAVLGQTETIGIEKLLDLPTMQDEEKVALMALLTHCLPAAFQTNQQLYALICCRMIDLSLQAGNCAHSARGYVSFAGVLSNAMARYRDAYRFAKLAVDLLHRLGDASVLPGAYFVWGLLASHWVKPVEESVELYRKGVLHGLATGDHLHAAYSAARSVSHQQFRGAPLADVHEEALAARALLLRVGEMHKLAYLEPRIRFIEWLRGQNGDRQDLGTADTSEAECTAAIKARGNLSFESEWFILLLMNRYLRGEYRQALAFARESQKLLPFSAAFVTRSEHTLFYALTLAALLPSAAADEREQFYSLLASQEAELDGWSRECPENFRHAHLLVRAERARTAGNATEAMHLYDQALAAAGEHGFLNMEALIAEVAARFWFDAGKSDFGSLYVERAIQVYESWGAQRRISALRQNFGLRGANESGTAGSTSRGAEQRGDALDLATLLKASQVLSGEIVLDRLLAKLLEMILENAGGDRAVLVLHEQGRPLIQGVRDSLGGETRLLMGESLYGSRLLSEGIANYVIRTGENLVLTEPAHSGRFRQDAYVTAWRPRSVLCAPIQHKGRLTGLIYLENNQIAGAFTAERLEALNVLMLQIAVSIENATLYSQREQQARKIEQANAALKREIAERVYAEQELARLSAMKLDELGAQVRERTRELEAAKLKLEEEAGAREQALAQLAESHEQIRSLAFEDGLTGLPNRRVLHEHLEKVLARSGRRHTEFAVLFVDLDNFKRINDTVGHQTADEVLRQLADTLSELIRAEDTLALYLRRGLDPDATASHASLLDSVVSRVGGDEFVILLPELRDRFAAGSVAQRILQQLERPFALGSAQVFVTASIGIATFPADGTNADELLRNADTAMYHAKQQGKAAFQYYSGEMNAASMERLRVENGLRLALDAGGFELHYQPQFEIATRRIIGAEALLRWRDQGRCIYPGTFIGIAEDSGLILRIGEWVIREACRQAREWRRLGLPSIPISVNVSPVQFRRQDLVGLIGSALREYGVDASALRVEITESSLMNVREDATQMLHELRALGVQVALDDFGTGYSSLSYLRSFPIDVVKIDGSFIAQMQQDEKTAAVIEAIINVARVLGMKVLAEGVERQAQLDHLRSLGCDFVQGHYTGAPLVPRDFAPLLAQPRCKAAMRS
jgi:predicted ATPase/predicted signal transduction protein with EAL and GGDEF domain/tRNA A-37 threonylcarbamoyl transferase component Bud32